MFKLVLVIDDDKYVYYVIEELFVGFCILFYVKNGDEGLR